MALDKFNEREIKHIENQEGSERNPLTSAKGTYLSNQERALPKEQRQARFTEKKTQALSDQTEKAFQMASVENVYKGRSALMDTWKSEGDPDAGLVDAYKAYLVDRDAFNTRAGDFAYHYGFDWLAERGVPPTYLEKIGELEAEKVGALFDYAKTLPGKSEAELRSDISEFKSKTLKLSVERNLKKYVTGKVEEGKPVFGSELAKQEDLDKDTEKLLRDIDAKTPDRTVEALNIDAESSLAFAKMAAAEQQLKRLREKAA